MIADPEIIWHPSPNFNKRPRGRGPEGVVMHGTAGQSALGDVRWLCDEVRDPKGGVYDVSLSYHYVVSRSGKIYQLVKESDRAWHAGKSRWLGREDCNDFTIGVGLSNRGPDRALYKAGDPYPEEYPHQQLDAAAHLVAWILARRGFDGSRLVGHSDVSPGRKSDPWAWFPWPEFRVAVINMLHPPPTPFAVMPPERYRPAA